jgi:hypothetical protein
MEIWKWVNDAERSCKLDVKQELEKVRVGMVRKFCIILFGPVSGIWAVADKP